MCRSSFYRKLSTTRFVLLCVPMYWYAVLLSSRKVLVLEDSQGPIFKSSLSLSLIPGRGGVSPPQSSPESSRCVEGRLGPGGWWRKKYVPACGPDSSGADAVLSRHRLRSVGTMETVVA